MRTEREIQRTAEARTDLPAYTPTEEERAPKPMPGLGLIKGLMVTLRTLLKRSVTQQYPREKPELPPRSRGVIALKQENCTVCYKCSRECPDWCIYIDAHKETHEPAGGGRGRSIKVLDRFDIDYALCMYCGICVEVCPFDALFWTPEFEYSEFRIENLLHDKEKLQEWTYTVLPPPELEAGAEVPEELAGTQKGQTEPVPPSAQPQPVKAEAVAAPEAAPTTEPAAPAPTRGDEAQGPATPTPTATQPKERAPRVEVEPDQETFDRVLKEQLDKGVDKRVAEGRARSAAILAARKKAQGG